MCNVSVVELSSDYFVGFNNDVVDWMSNDDDEQRSSIVNKRWSSDDNEQWLSDSEIHVDDANNSNSSFNGDLYGFDSGNGNVDIGGVILSAVADANDGGGNSDDDFE